MKTKKYLSLILALLIVAASLTGCVKNSNVPKPNPEPNGDGLEVIIPSPGGVEGGLEVIAPSPGGTQEGPGNSGDSSASPGGSEENGIELDEDGWYYDKEQVAAYIDCFGRLPGNYMTKSEAKKLGWSGGSLEKYAKGRVIGGDSFGNREGLLPSKKGRSYTECDIDTLGAKERGAKRIVFSNDGLIYYTDDHYKSFELLYGE